MDAADQADRHAYIGTGNQPGHHGCKVPDVGDIAMGSLGPDEGPEEGEEAEEDDERSIVPELCLLEYHPLDSFKLGDNLHEDKDEYIGGPEKGQVAAEHVL